MYYRTVTLCRK